MSTYPPMDDAMKERARQNIMAILDTLKSTVASNDPKATRAAHAMQAMHQAVGELFGKVMYELDVVAKADPVTLDGPFHEIAHPFKPDVTLLVSFRCTIGVKR